MINRALFRHLLTNQIIVALIVIAVGWLLLELSEVIIVGFIAYILMAAMAPAVEVLHTRKIPRTLAAAILYLAILAVLVLLIFPLIPFFTKQIISLFKGLPGYFHNAGELLGLNLNTEEFQQIFSSQFGSIGRNALQVTSQLFGGVFTLLTIVVLSFYLLIDHARVQKTIASLFAKSAHQKSLQIIEKVEDKLGAWLRGQMLLSFVIGLFTWIGLSLIGIEYALPLALLAGMLEIVPTIGPIIAAVPAVIIALSVSPTIGIFVIIFYIILQILENNFLVPRIMQRAVGLHPIVVILGIIIGGKLLGILGALLAVPFISLVMAIASEVREE